MLKSVSQSVSQSRDLPALKRREGGLPRSFEDLGHSEARWLLEG